MLKSLLSWRTGARCSRARFPSRETTSPPRKIIAPSDTIIFLSCLQLSVSTRGMRPGRGWRSAASNHLQRCHTFLLFAFAFLCARGRASVTARQLYTAHGCAPTCRGRSLGTSFRTLVPDSRDRARATRASLSCIGLKTSANWINRDVVKIMDNSLSLNYIEA
jgi:hypothetical protein